MNEVQRFRKKPVVIEAVQVTGENRREVAVWIRENGGNSDGMCGDSECQECMVRIFTLEGTMTASDGDWIIKGVNGEFYPCKPDIFEATYEPAGATIEVSASGPYVQPNPAANYGGPKRCGCFFCLRWGQ
jgi:hypothetical protein